VEAEISQGHVRVLGAESSGFIKGGQHTGGERGVGTCLGGIT
jgi:hypothetical protein